MSGGNDEVDFCTTPGCEKCLRFVTTGRFIMGGWRESVLFSILTSISVPGLLLAFVSTNFWLLVLVLLGFALVWYLHLRRLQRCTVHYRIGERSHSHRVAGVMGIMDGWDTVMRVGVAIEAENSALLCSLLGLPTMPDAMVRITAWGKCEALLPFYRRGPAIIRSYDADGVVVGTFCDQTGHARDVRVTMRTALRMLSEATFV